MATSDVSPMLLPSLDCLLSSMQDQLRSIGETMSRLNEQHRREITRATAALQQENEALECENRSLRERIGSAVEDGSGPHTHEQQERYGRPVQGVESSRCCGTGGLVSLMAKAVAAVDAETRGSAGLCFNRAMSRYTCSPREVRTTPLACQTTPTLPPSAWGSSIGHGRGQGHARITGSDPREDRHCPRNRVEGLGSSSTVAPGMCGIPPLKHNIASEPCKKCQEQPFPVASDRSRSTLWEADGERSVKDRDSKTDDSMWPLWQEVEGPEQQVEESEKTKVMSQVMLADLHRRTCTSPHRLWVDDCTPEPDEGDCEHSLRSFIVFPGSWPNFVWEALGGMHIAWDLIMIPATSFTLPEATLFSVFEWSTPIYWSMDIPYQFFVSYEDMGKVERRPWRVASNYLKTWFLPDLFVVTLDWVILVSDSAAGASRSWRAGKFVKAFRVLRAVRLIRLIKMFRMLSRFMDSIKSLEMVIYMKVAYLTLGVLLCAHYICCYWYAIATWGPPGTANWVQEHGLETASFDVLYLSSLHWSLAQSGFASINVYPTNAMESCYASAIAVVWLLLVMVVLSSFTVWAMQLRDASLEREKQEAGIRMYLTENQITATVRNHVLRFLRLNYRKLVRRTHDSDIAVFNNLPATLRVELRKQKFMPTLGLHPLFSKLDQHEMEPLCHLAVYEHYYAAGRKVFAKGEEAKRMIFVVSGDMSYYLDSQRTVALSPGEWIGEAALWERWRHVGWLVSTTACESLEVDVIRFLAIMKELERQGTDLTGIRTYAALVMQHFSEQQTDLWDDLEELGRIVMLALPECSTWTSWETSRATRRSRAFGQGPSLGKTTRF